jgi:predicted N-formylglutamate amidohydrolase
LLYDPGRRLERELCGRWLDAVREIDPTLRARRNYPYLGTADGLTTALRRRFGAAEYAGIELEVNQAVLTDSRRAAAIARTLAAGLERALAGC